MKKYNVCLYLGWTSQFILITCLNLVGKCRHDNTVSRIFGLKFACLQVTALNMEDGECLLSRFTDAGDVSISPHKITRRSLWSSLVSSRTLSSKHNTKCWELGSLLINNYCLHGVCLCLWKNVSLQCLHQEQPLLQLSCRSFLESL